MKRILKKIVKAFPLTKKIMNSLSLETEQLKKELLFYSNQAIDLRRQIKLLRNEKIKVVFLCWRPQVWGSLKTVYDAMKDDDAFDVTIVTIPNKKQLPKWGLNHEFYESEGAEAFWKGDDVISGYDYATGEWLDLRLLKADYVCFQQPYNICRTGAEKSWVVSRYAKLFYVHYGQLIFNGVVEKDVYPPDFMRDLSLAFPETEEQKKIMEKVCDTTRTKLIVAGNPRFDNLSRYLNCNSPVWKSESHTDFRILWTPRWSTNEGTCTFFDYKDVLLEYCQTHKNLNFVFRPHPQAFLNFSATGELSETEANTYKAKYTESENTRIDFSKEFTETFWSSDVLIADMTSLMPEYFLTGKPIIYTHKHVDMFNEFGSKMAEGFYKVANWTELKNTLEMLINGTDPLREKRQQIIKDLFYFPPEGAGVRIKNAIKEDFFRA